MNRKKIFTAVLTIALCAAMTAPAYAAQNPFAQMEAQSRQAVEAAIKAGTVPPDTTIYDCMYGADKNGVTIVIQYKGKDGNWIDIATGKKAETVEPSGNATNNQKSLTADELKAYTDKVFELVNKEREKAGLDEVVWDGEFAACAQIRAEELTKKYSHERPDPVNDGISWPQNTSGIGIYNAPSVADEQGIPHTWIMENIAITSGTPEGVVKVWMDSTGHRNNILRDSHTRCGVGVYQVSNALHWALWFDDYTEN